MPGAEYQALKRAVCLETNKTPRGKAVPGHTAFKKGFFFLKTTRPREAMRCPDTKLFYAKGSLLVDS